MTTRTGQATHPRPAPHTFVRSLLLHLVPGAAAAAAYFALVPLARHWGMPTVAALAASAIVTIAPIQLTILKLHSMRHRGRPSDATVQLRARLGARTVLACAIAVAALAAAIFALTRPLGTWVKSAAFAWWPTPLIPDLGTDPGFSRSALLWTALLLLVGSVLVASVVEELYFRGFLLPRMPEQLGRAAPVVHAGLFAAYHLWTPWLTPTRILAILPLVYVVLRKRSVHIGIAAHVAVNAIDLATLTGYLVATA